MQKKQIVEQRNNLKVLGKSLLSRLKILGGLNEINYEGARIRTHRVSSIKAPETFALFLQNSLSLRKNEILPLI